MNYAYLTVVETVCRSCDRNFDFLKPTLHYVTELRRIIKLYNCIITT